MRLDISNLKLPLLLQTTWVMQVVVVAQVTVGKVVPEVAK